MKARSRYRFYPTPNQQRNLAQLFGCVRVVGNDALALCKAAEKLPNYNQLSALLTSAKKTEERAWLNESSVPLQQSLRQLATAYKNFFAARKSQRKGAKVGLPRFKKKTNNQS
jgi:putative transposase